jgi:hypothetical protein
MRPAHWFGALALGTLPLAAQIPVSDFTSTYSYPSHTRGFFFQAPVAFTVIALQVPDETNAGLQNVALYRTPANPTTSGSVTPVFVQTGVASSQRVPVIPPQQYQVGEWFGVVGACGTATTNMQNSYGATTTPWQSRVLGNPVGLQRLMLQSNVVVSLGVGPLYTNTASLGRVRVYVAGQGEALQYGPASGPNVPVLRPVDPSPPSIGAVGELLALPGSPANTGAVLTLGLAMSNVPTPFGPLLNLPHALHVPLPGAVPPAGRRVSLTLPQDTTLLGLQVYFQHAELQATTVALGNGVSWLVGR